MRAERRPRQPQQQHHAPRAAVPDRACGQQRHDAQRAQAQSPPAAHLDRLPARRRPLQVRQQMLDQLIAHGRRRQRGQLAQVAPLAFAGIAGSDIDTQLPALEPALQRALAQRPRLDTAPRHTGAHAGQQAAGHGQPTLVLTEPEAVVTQQREHHRQHPQHDPEAHHGDHRGNGPQPHPGVQVAGIAEGLAAAGFDHIGDAPARKQLHHRAQHRHHHDPAAVGQQADPHHLAGAQRQQHVFGRLGDGRLTLGRDRRGLAALAYQALQCEGLVELEDPHLRLGAIPTGRFQLQLGHAEQAMQRVLMDHHVVDAREGDLAPIAREHATAHGDRGRSDPVAIGEVLQHRERHQRHHRDHRAE